MDIDADAIVRKIKIDMITDSPNSIIKYFMGLWEKLSVVETNVYHTNGGEYIYYKDVGNMLKQWIFYRDDKNRIFWANFDHYWEYLEVEFDLNYTEAQITTQALIRIVLSDDKVKPCSTWRGIKINNTLNSDPDISLPDAKHFLQSNQINTSLYNL